MLHSAVTDVSVTTIGPIFKGHTLQKKCAPCFNIGPIAFPEVSVSASQHCWNFPICSHHQIRTHQFLPSHWNTRRQLGFYFIQEWRQWRRRSILLLNNTDVMSNTLGQPGELSDQAAGWTFWGANPNRGKKIYQFSKSSRPKYRLTQSAVQEMPGHFIWWHIVPEVRLISCSHLE